MYIFKSKITPPKDVFLSKYKHNFSLFLSELNDNNIGIYDYHFIFDNKYIESFLEVASTPQTNTIRILGPNLWIEDKFLMEFINEHSKKHENVYLYHDKLAYDKRVRRMELNNTKLDRFVFKIAKKYKLR